MNFSYSAEATNYLKEKDKTLAKVIDEVGIIERRVNSDLFVSLVDNIIGQQISGKAADTVMRRFREKVGEINPESVYTTSIEDIQKCGMSFRKAEYIKEIADHVHNGKLNLDELHDMEDDQLCKRLSQIRGIGKWTAEMLMIFSMERMDVVSFDDLAIQRGMRMIYRHRKITRKLFDKYKRRYSPYGSVASLYLWEISSGKYEGYSDPKPKNK